MFRVRFLKKEDFNSIIPLLIEGHEIHKENREDVFSDLNLDFINKQLNQAFKDDDSHIFVVEDIEKKKIVGFALSKIHVTFNIPLLKSSSYLFIDNFIINKDYRNKGVGKILFTSIKNFCLLKKLDNIQLNVWNFNEGAIKFYKGLGFSTSKKRLELKLDMNDLNLIDDNFIESLQA